MESMVKEKSTLEAPTETLGLGSGARKSVGSASEYVFVNVSLCTELCLASQSTLHALL